VLGRLAGDGSGRRGVLTVVAVMASGKVSCTRGEAQLPLLYTRARLRERAASPRRKGGGNHGAACNGRGAQGSPAGGAAGGGRPPAGSTGERGRGFRARPEGDPLTGRADTIIGLGHAADRLGGPDAEGRAAVRRSQHGATRRHACALALVQFNYPSLKAPNS
jgi:hypothetical protein